jgi:hypothetical protein
VKPGERVLFRSWFRYYLRPDIIQCIAPFAQPMTVDADMIRRDGIAYIFVERHGYQTQLEVDPALAEVLYQDEIAILYRVNAPLHDMASAVCQEERPGYWRVVWAGQVSDGSH